jgi:RNA polymerase sigma factor (sigma-70 family)
VSSPSPAKPAQTTGSAEGTPRAVVFVTTRWSVVLAARDRESPDSAAALEALCRAYWYPLYAYVRRLGHSPEDAQDLTQEFFLRLLQKDYLQAVAREKGRFRAFLIVALKRFLANEWDRARARKRGGGKTPLSLDAAAAEKRYAIEPATGLSADRIYERRWALTLLDEVMARLREEFLRAGKAAEFEGLKVFLTAGKGVVPYAEVALKMGMTEGALRVAVHRVRRRFRELFREQIAHTVGSPEEIDEEVHHLLGVLSG